MRRELPSGTVTFLFTDVEGSTRLLHELGAEAYAEALAEHRRAIREACVAEGGVEVDTQGDAFFFAFPTAPGALAAAAAFSEALASGPIQVRVGLHTGTPLLAEEGYVGDDVHFAARVGAAGHGGQVLVSASTAGLVDGALIELGEHRLKDIAEAVLIFQLGAGAFPPLKTISNTNLPRPASSFVGREAELVEVLARIEAGARLVTLTGPGGSGKTRLALEAAATLVPEYKAGVFWVGLAALRDSALVTETIAQTLGAKDGLAEHVGERELLLLLDNLEQVIEAAPELASLLERCPNLALLVTSRELLRVKGEVEYAVPPLAQPEAVALFCQRSQLEPSEEIAELCARLDSLPLAVELAAARTKALSPAQILERLSQRLDLLKGGRDADPRQQTLRATIEWSYDLLSEREQQLFRRLSLFAGGCTLEAAEEVVDADLDTLQSLVEKSLLRFTNERYWMLATISDYARSKCGEAGESDSVSARHAAYVLAWATRAREGLQADDTHWLAAYAHEQANVRQALGWSDARAEQSTLLDLVACLGGYWEVRGEWREGAEWAKIALEHGASERSARTGRIHGNAASFARHAGDSEAARRHATAALSIFRELDDTRRVVWVLNLLATIASERGDYEEAEQQLAEAAELASGDNDEFSAAMSTGNLADLLLRRGDRERAAHHADRALESFRNLDWKPGIAWCLYFRALLAGDTGSARAAAREGLSLAHEIGDAETRVWFLLLVGALQAQRGRAAEASTLLGVVDGLSDAIGLVLTGDESRLYEDTKTRLGAIHRDDESAYERGRQMSPDEAVARALASLD